MSKLSCLLLLTVLYTLAVADTQHKILANDVFEYEEFVSKCYDGETKLVYKVDSVWYPEGKCELRTCSLGKNSKSPIIKTMSCEPCTSCSLPNEICQPLIAEKNYPKCCPRCITKPDILKKRTKKYKDI